MGGEVDKGEVEGGRDGCGIEGFVGSIGYPYEIGVVGGAYKVGDCLVGVPVGGIGGG